MYQNFEVIDSYSPSKGTQIRVSKVEPGPDYVVATYSGDAYAVRGRDPIPGLDSSVLVEAKHFKSESEAMRYFLYLIDPKEFPLKN